MITPELPMQHQPPMLKRNAFLEEPLLSRVFPTAGASVSVSSTGQSKILVKQLAGQKGDFSNSNITFQAEFDKGQSVIGPESRIPDEIAGQ